jgi:hypothetical protein
MLEIFFIICLEIALLAAAFLYIYNSIKKGILNDSPSVRRFKQEQTNNKSNDKPVTSSDSTTSPDITNETSIRA